MCVHGGVYKSETCISNIDDNKNIDKGSTKLRDAEQHLTAAGKLQFYKPQSHLQKGENFLVPVADTCVWYRILLTGV